MSERELAELSPAERQELAVALIAVGCTMETPEADRRRRRLFLGLIGLSVVVLAVWIVGLGVTLPQQETTGQWRTAWIGFDVALLLAFATCGWAAWRGRHLLIPATLVTGTLLLCDAWFDVVLSWNTDERWWSVATAAAIEIPLAVLFFWLARRLVRRTVALARTRLGLPGDVPGLHDMSLFDPLLTGPPARGTLNA